MSRFTVAPKAAPPPVNDAFAVQEEEAHRNLRRVEPAEGGGRGRTGGREHFVRARVAGRPHASVLFHLPGKKLGKDFFFSPLLSSDGRLMKGEETRQMKGGVMMRERWK